MKSKLVDRIGTFTVVPDKFINDPTISHEAFRLYVVLRQYVNSGRGNEVAFPDYETLKAKTGLQSYSTIAKKLRELEAGKWIERRKRFGKSTIYTLTIPTLDVGLHQMESITTPGVVQSYTPSKTNKTNVTRIIESEVPEAIASPLLFDIPKAKNTTTAPDEPPEFSEKDIAVSEAVPASAAKTQKPPRPRNELFDAIAELCKLDARINGAYINKTATNLRKVDATPEQIKHFGCYWYAVDFRGLKGQPPAPPQLVLEWRKAMEWKDTKSETVSFIAVGGTPGVEWRYVPGGERVLRDENTKTTYRGAEAQAMAAKFGVTA